MAAVTFTIDPDELLGLRALAAVSETAISGAQPRRLRPALGWTGYPGNTLWDWLQLLLPPLVFPTFLLPGLVNWITGNAAKHPAQHDDLSPDPSAGVLTCAAAPHTTRERGQQLQKGRNDGSAARRHGA